MRKTYAVTHTMETPIRNIGYQCYMINPDTEEKIWVDNTDMAVLSRPVNSVLDLSDFFLPYGIDIFGNFIRPMTLNELTITGYDMSTVGWQTITFSYVNADGKTLTCTTTLHVFGDTTWRTIWPAVENYEERVALVNQDQPPYSPVGFKVKLGSEWVYSNWNAGTTTTSCFLPADSRNVEDVYIGWRVTRKLRITYELPNPDILNSVKIYGQSQTRDNLEHTDEFNWNSEEQMIDGPDNPARYLEILNGINGWPVISLNRGDGGLTGGQVIFALLQWNSGKTEGAQPNGKAILWWHVTARRVIPPVPGEHPEIIDTSLESDKVGQDIIIKKIEVLE